MELSGKPSLRKSIWDLQAEGGPVLVEMWSVDATDAMARDPERYKLELPPGVAPGSAHDANLARAAKAAAEVEKAKEIDPQFGRNADKDARIAELERKLAEAQAAPTTPNPPPAPVAVEPPPPPSPPDPPAPKPVAAVARPKGKPRGRPFTKKAHHAQPGALP